jgi:hypothetical protein
MFTQEEILEIASLPESAFRYRRHVEVLLKLYQWVREQWTQKAITEQRNPNLSYSLSSDRFIATSA